MNPTPYTDDQILEALEKAMDTVTSRDQLFVREVEDRELYWEAQRGARLQIGKKFLKLLSKSQPILADDGRSLEQVAIQEHEKAPSGIKWFAAANAVATVAITRAVQRIEAVTEKELHDQYWKGQTYVGTSQAIERIRARLIAAVKGEERPLMTKNIPGDKCPLCGAEEVESNTPNTVYACGSSDYDGRPETFHPGDQCDSRGEAKQSEAVADDPYAILKAYAKAGARLRFEDEFGWSEWAANEDWSWTQPPEEYQVHPADLHLLESEPWTPKPGDVVQLKSGGAKMTVRLLQDENYLCTWTSDYGVFERFFPLACLQQA